MKNVYEVVKDYGERLEEFKSPLSRDWETVLFKAIDILHNIELDENIKTKHIENTLLPMIALGKFDEKAINKGIQSVQSLNDSADRVLAQRLKEVLDLLFAVKVSFNKRK
jgi:hypothetical protein